MVSFLLFLKSGCPRIEIGKQNKQVFQRRFFCIVIAMLKKNAFFSACAFKNYSHPI